MDFNTLFQGFNDKKVLIVGDAMIDAYMWGEVNRMSPASFFDKSHVARKDRHNSSNKL